MGSRVVGFSEGQMFFTFGLAEMIHDGMTLQQVRDIVTACYPQMVGHLSCGKGTPEG
jgi:hypothetical protein